ncbi:MAG: hypothetical protein LBN07_02805 [Christensenellaceae bacterium]|nr:hypothetical protein [Christensenellaceae bacterium]
MKKQRIEQFATEVNGDTAKENYKIALNVIIEALEGLTGKVSTLTPEEVRVFPMGELTNGTFVDTNDEIEIALVTSNPQMAFTNSAYIRLMSEIKKQKDRDAVSSDNTTHQIIQLLFDEFIKLFSADTTIIITQQGIKILSNKELGFKIMLRLGTYNAYDTNFVLSLWNPVRKTTENLDIFGYAEAMKKKDDDTDGNFNKIVRIFKNFRKAVVANKWFGSSFANKYLVEMVVYNIPNSLLKGSDVYKVYVKSINYLLNCPLSSFKSFNGGQLSSFPIAGADQYHIKTFLSSCSRLLALKDV